MNSNAKIMYKEMQWGWDDDKVRRVVGGSDGSTNRCAAIGRERVASLDDVKATTLKENKKEK